MMKVKHIITIHFLIALLLLLYLVGCASIPGKDWKCRHWVASRGEMWYSSGKKIDIVQGLSYVRRSMEYQHHVKIEGERTLDTADEKAMFVELSRLKLNQGYPKDEEIFKKFVESVKKEEVFNETRTLS